MNMSFHDIIDIANEGNLHEIAITETYEDYIESDLFLDKLSENIHQFLLSSNYDENFYNIYNSIKMKEIDEHMNRVEFYLVLKTILIINDTIKE